MRVGRRPQRSAARPKTNVPIGLMASLSRMATVTSEMSVWNSAATPLRTNHQQEDDERLECPAEKTRRHRVLLLAGPPADASHVLKHVPSSDLSKIEGDGEPQVATAAELVCKLVIQHDRLRVPETEEAVRLRWKTRDHDTRSAGLDVRRYDAANEIADVRARFSDTVRLRHLRPQAWSSSRGCVPKPCMLSDHCSATTAPLTGCRRAIEAKAVIGR
jgi:hypothetical protein